MTDPFFTISWLVFNELGKNHEVNTKETQNYFLFCFCFSSNSLLQIYDKTMDGAFSNLSPDFWSGSSTGALGCIIPLCKVLSDFILLLAHSALFINHAKLRSLSYLLCMKQPSFALPMLCNKSIYRAQWRPFHVHTDSKRHLLEQKVFRSSFPSFSTVAHLGLSLRQKYSIIAAQAMSESCSVQPTVTVRAFAAFLNYRYLGFSSVSQVHSIFQ